MRMDIHKSKISLQRWIMFFTAGLAILVFALHLTANICVYVLGGLALFFGATDFGRQCPLFLSVQHLYARIHMKK